MKLSTTYTGDSWAHIRKQLGAAAESVNGKSPTGWPAVSNAHALAIAQSLKKLLKANKESVPASAWPELWYFALGYQKPGDKFNMTTAHANAPAPDIVVESLWEFVSHATTRLDLKKALPRLLVLDLSHRGYQRAADDAYAQLKKDRAGKIIVPPIPDPTNPPPLPTPPLPKVPGLPRARDLGLLLLLLVVAASTRRRK